MRLAEWYYLPIAALINTLVVYLWHTKIGQKEVKGKNAWILILVGSVFNAWGLDVIQRLVEVVTLNQMMQISLGCWLFIAVATSAKHYALNGWSKKTFWIDYAGDLLGFIVMGTVIYVLT